MLSLLTIVLECMSAKKDHMYRHDGSCLARYYTASYHVLAQKPVTRADEQRMEADRLAVKVRARSTAAPTRTRTDGPIANDCRQ